MLIMTSIMMSTVVTTMTGKRWNTQESYLSMLTIYVRREFVAESPGFLIQAHLNSIEFQMRTLGRLTRSLQEAAPNAKEDMESLEELVNEVGKHFGTMEAVEALGPGMRFTGRKALDEVRRLD